MAERSKAPDSNNDDDGDASFGRECGQRATTTAATMETSGFVGSNPTSDKNFFFSMAFCTYTARLMSQLAFRQILFY